MANIPSPSKDGAVDPLYKKNKSVGYSSAVGDLGTMFEDLLKDEQVMANLPKGLQGGLRKIYRMTQDPFKYASSKEGAVAEDTQVDVQEPDTKFRRLNDTISQALKGTLPKKVQEALLNAQGVIKNELSTQQAPTQQAAPAQPTAEPQKATKPEVQKGVGEYKLPPEIRRDQRDEQKHEKVIQQYSDKQDMYGREESAVGLLKRKLMGSRHYADLYNALPGEIRKELEKLSLDPDNLKYLSTTRSKLASRNVIDRYLESLGG